MKLATSWMYVFLALLSLIGFAANNLLARYAADRTTTDALTFTLVRLASGAVVLVWLPKCFRQDETVRLRWDGWSGLVLVGYAIPYAYAYHDLLAGVGTLVLFLVAQLTIFGYGFLFRGERPVLAQSFGLLIALAGFSYMVQVKFANIFDARNWTMVVAGVCWGAYVIRGKDEPQPAATSLGNFFISSAVAAGTWCVVYSCGKAELLPARSLDPNGAIAAVASGALASGIGYLIWYHVVKNVAHITAGTIQLLAPILATGAAFLLLSESPKPYDYVYGSLALIGVGVYFSFKPSENEADEK